MMEVCAHYRPSSFSNNRTLQLFIPLQRFHLARTYWLAQNSKLASGLG
jgi:hypothetical protein